MFEGDEGRLTEQAFLRDFAGDVPAARARVLFATQMPFRRELVSARVNAAAWRTKPSHYAVSVQDHPRRMARDPKPAGGVAAALSTPTAEVEPKPAKPASKASLVLAMLQRPDGVTIAQLVAATGWLPHTTRAALTSLKKKGHRVTSAKTEGEARVYRVVPG